VKDAAQSPKSEAGTTLVCFALEDEARAFRKLMGGQAEVSILITGIGQKNAERSVCNFLQQNSPRRVFTCGFAGGLDPELKVGDVVFEMPLTRPAGHPLPVGRGEGWGEGLSANLLTAGAKPVKFFCAEHIATTAGEKQKLRATTQADAVEMESAFIHGICTGRGIPCATVRVISDAAHEDLPLDFNQLANPDQSLNFGKLAFTIVKSPGKIPALLRLQKNTNFAARRLAEVLSRVT
jgi:hypothetical protein